MSLWARFGQLPAVGVVAVFFAAAVAAALVFVEPAETVGLVALLALLVGYCVARPSGGLDVFLIAAFPSAASAIVADVAGVERWWIGVPLVPVALALLAATERDPMRESRSSSVGDDDLENAT